MISVIGYPRKFSFGPGYLHTYTKYKKNLKFIVHSKQICKHNIKINVSKEDFNAIYRVKIFPQLIEDGQQIDR